MTTLIKNGKIITMTGAVIESGCVLFDEKILYIGTEEKDADTVIDANGAIVMPGLIDAHCHVGMFEDSLGFEGDDGKRTAIPLLPTCALLTV